MKAKIDLLRRKLIHKARERVTEKFTGRDQHVIKAIGVLGDLDNVFNLLFEQVREWYGMHFPELERMCNDNAVYLKLAYPPPHPKNFFF